MAAQTPRTSAPGPPIVRWTQSSWLSDSISLPWSQTGGGGREGGELPRVLGFARVAGLDARVWTRGTLKLGVHQNEIHTGSTLAFGPLSNSCNLAVMSVPQSSHPATPSACTHARTPASAAYLLPPRISRQLLMRQLNSFGHKERQYSLVLTCWCCSVLQLLFIMQLDHHGTLPPPGVASACSYAAF